MSEDRETIQLAHRLLDEPYADPDDDLRMLSRQLIRHAERVEILSNQLRMRTSEDICEALVRHVETTGSECFEKNFVQDKKITCTVWCIVGPNAQQVREGFCAMLAAIGFNRNS